MARLRMLLRTTSSEGGKCFLASLAAPGSLGATASTLPVPDVGTPDAPILALTILLLNRAQGHTSDPILKAKRREIQHGP